MNEATQSRNKLIRRFIKKLKKRGKAEEVAKMEETADAEEEAANAEVAHWEKMLISDSPKPTFGSLQNYVSIYCTVRSLLVTHITVRMKLLRAYFFPCFVELAYYCSTVRPAYALEMEPIIKKSLNLEDSQEAFTFVV
jgi:hypothetical protein